MGLEEFIEASGQGRSLTEGISVKTFAASLATAITVFAVEFLLFLFLKGKLTRIYQPRTYLVPERERTKPSPPGLFRWIIPVFRTSNSEFIRKCGLDAYFFLRYLRMLLKIFIPLALLILPVLLPINGVGGKGTSFVNGTEGKRWNVTGLDRLGWGNVRPENASRYWAHCIMAIIVVFYVCAVFFDELRGYIRIRQSYLTSPQHRLRASATTVLVTAIPQEWLTMEALESLFDVFPGGVRNIWINRNYDDLNEKVKIRNDLALRLEEAETNLIAKCKKAQLKQAKREAKKANKGNKDTKEQEKDAAEAQALSMAMGPGVSSGDPHQGHTLNEVLHRPAEAGEKKTSQDGLGLGVLNPLVAVEAVGHGVTKLGKTVLGGVKMVEGGIDGTLNRTGGFVAETEDTILPRRSGSTTFQRHETFQGTTATESEPPTPATTTGDQITSYESHQASRKRPFWPRKLSSHSKSNGSLESDEYRLTDPESPVGSDAAKQKSKKHKEGDDADGARYPLAYNPSFNSEELGEPMWKKYVRQKDRDTYRLPLIYRSWMPSLWLIGKKVDTIDHCRKELARLNMEIEIDQQHPERFPLMNSAFIQFNHQVAAHMACQTVSHHLPKQMAPRIVEISPDDVIWDNMSIRWWERYLRTFGIVTVVCAMVIGWAVPVAFTGILSQLSTLEYTVPWLSWLTTLPNWFISAVQGILPPLFLAILMAILPLILRFLSSAQGLSTGMAVELAVQHYYFAFMFVQLFLVVTIASSIATVFHNFSNVVGWPELLATNIPRSSNYFFSYMILRALSVSAGALLQIFALISWFILAPILDSTARKKWARTTNLTQMQWGTFFPIYTTLAAIGLIYSVVAPLILVFNIITFTLFWVVYRYNTLYVIKFQFDTGGLLFPRAINQLFTGLYFMEVCLIGLFVLVEDENQNLVCKGQAICMAVVLVLTMGYQILLNNAFNPLIQYLPITLEDDAALRDQEFHRAQLSRLGLPLDGEDDDHEDTNQERGKQPETGESAGIELDNLDGNKKRRQKDLTTPKLKYKHQSWLDRSLNQRSNSFGIKVIKETTPIKALREKLAQDTETQVTTDPIGHALFGGIHDELEDLTPEERDQLIKRAFQHEAVRAKRPVIWIPRDDLGVSDDEIYRTQQFSKHIWISNEYQALDAKCRTIFSRSPPDFSEVDLIQL